MFLLIPNRIKEIKDAGRAEAQAEIRQALAEAWEEGRAEGRQEVRERRNRERYAEEGRLVRALLACHSRGEITLDQFRAVLAEHYGGKND